MADNEYINSGYITKMGDNSTHNGSAGQPVDGVDFPHSGLFKALNAMATTGYAVLTASAGTGSKNFNMQMNDGTSVTVITVRTGKVVRGGVLMGATTEATITEVTSAPNDVQFREGSSDTTGQSRYNIIVVDSTNAIKIRNTTSGSETAIDQVADLSAGDIPIAILEVKKGAAKATRRIQYLTSSETDGIGLDIDGYSALGGTGLHQTQDHFVFSDNGTEKKITFSNLQDAIFADVSGDATIAAGGALTVAANAIQTGMVHDDVATELAGDGLTDSSGVLAVGAGTGIDVTSNAIAVDVSDFLTNGANDRIVTATGTDGMNAEANLTFGTSYILAVTGSVSATVSVATNGNFSAGYEVLNIGGGGPPVPTLTKKVIYSFDLVPAGNTFAMPNAVANQIHHIKNIDPVNAITITATGGETIDLNDTGHPYVTAPSTITLAPQTGVILQGANDSIAPLTPGWMIIGIA